MAMVNDFIIGYDFLIKADDTVVQLAGASRFPYIGTPIFQYKEFLTGFGGNYGTDCHTTWLMITSEQELLGGGFPGQGAACFNA